MMRATWNGTTIAPNDDTVHVEGNHYFPQGAVDWYYPDPMAGGESVAGRLAFWRGVQVDATARAPR